MKNPLKRSKSNAPPNSWQINQKSLLAVEYSIFEKEFVIGSNLWLKISNRAPGDDENLSSKMNAADRFDLISSGNKESWFSIQWSMCVTW